MTTSHETFQEYVRPLLRRLHVAARQYTARPDDAHDLVQEVLLRAWRGFTPTDDRTYKKAWLFVILRRTALEWHRTTTRRIRTVPVTDTELTAIASTGLNEPFCPLPTMDEKRFREFLDDHVIEALDALEPRFREVLILSVAGGLSYREIAEVLDTPIGTAMSRMARARRALRERLAEYVRHPLPYREDQP